MSGGGGSTNTIQSSTPWLGVQSQLSNLYGQAANEFNNGGGPQAYTGQTTAPLNSTQTSALGDLTNIANGGYGTLNSAQQTGLNTTLGMVNGTDPTSQQLATEANGGGASETGLTQMLYGQMPVEQALQATGNGSSAADQSLLSTANGSSTSDQYLNSTLGSNYLNVQNNPALNNAMNAANYNTNFNYTNDVMPALASQYSAAGRFGSGAMGTATNQANNTLATQIGNTNSTMAEQAYQTLLAQQSANAGTLGSQETNAGSALGQIQNNANSALGTIQNNAGTQLGAQMQNASGLLNNRQGSALQLLPGMSTQGLTNAQAGLTAGNQYQSQAQTALTNYINQYMAEQNQPVQNLASYSGLLSGASGLNTTSTSGNTSNVINPYSTAIGAGSLGLGAYNSGLLASGATATGAGLFSTGGAALSGAALDSALAGSATEGVLAGGAGGSALMGLAAA